jgi:hypothetical protein
MQLELGKITFRPLKQHDLNCLKMHFWLVKSPKKKKKKREEK